MMRLVATLLISLASGATALPARADDRAREPEAVMHTYFRLWNAHDAHGVWTEVYHLDAAQQMKSEADLAAEFARLKAQGYDHSDLQSVHACLLTANTAMAVMRFSRLKADGTPLPPKDRASLYTLRKFPEGWRITGLTGVDATAKIECASATEPAH